ncbi:uncharacterized protein LOC130993921 [Salvia miltiorrhiza]|uniref:uncharacterized protein LOC130993921 n=1 Tax=Salvia miltiorrhiza TaxID=226208 RepID=UPI0025ACC305|nr:uncharacterized protein LOC130993921 [Salvia miltiorrhiza]
MQVVQKVWEETNIPGWSCFVFKEKLKKLKLVLKEWNKNSFENIEHSIKSLKDELQAWDILDYAFGLDEKETIRRNKIKANLILQTRNKISLLQHKAKARWLKEGYLNSSFYHKVIVGRRKKNEMLGMMFENQWIDEPTVIKERVKNFFEKNFRKRNRTLPILRSDFAARKLSNEDKMWLIRPFTEEEIKDAIWSCEGNKSPGPEDFNINFWIKSWEVIKDDFIQVMKDFHTKGKIPRDCNSSFIVLIPNKDEAYSLDEFRPISLICNLYNIIAKVLAGKIEGSYGLNHFKKSGRLHQWSVYPRRSRDFE